MSGTSKLPPLREVIKRYGLSARKGLGQHFLLDLNLTRKIARAAGGLEGTTVYEVGPGPGGLTRMLLEEGAGEVIAIEKDSRCLDALADLSKHYAGRLTVIEGDALALDERTFFADKPAGSVKVVSNLPYNVGTALLTKWLSADPWPPWWHSLTLMFQKEVAERLVAGPGSKTYGRLSILANWRSHARLMFDVPASAFTPPPKVTSSIIHLTPGDPLVDGLDLKTLEFVSATIFGKRRKMLRAVLKPLSDDVEGLLGGLNIAPTARGETLTVAQICELAKAIRG